MKKITPQLLKLWTKRLLVYFTGLYCMAIGVVLSVKSGLGVSPVGALANVLYQISMAKNAPSFCNLGNWTIAVYCLYILTELILLRKKFKPAMLLQVVASVFFGQLVNAATLMLAWMPAAGNYGGQLLYLFGSIPMVSVGVMLYLSPNILPTPGDGMSLAISDVTGLSPGRQQNSVRLLYGGHFRSSLPVVFSRAGGCA